MEDAQLSQIRRSRGLYFVVAIVFFVFSVRLFSIQILRHDYYSTLAANGQERKFVIAPTRGTIYIKDGDDNVPVVLNEVQPTMFADPSGITDAEVTSQLIVDAIGGSKDKYAKLINDANDSVYVVLKKRLSNKQATLLKEANIGGVGLQDVSYRVYPEGGLAAQVLGFSNDDGEGQYGVEAALEDELNGEPGLLKAVTDVNGIPLTSEESIDRPAVNGEDVTLTIDRNVQQFVEEALEKGVKSSKGRSGSAIVVDPYTGKVLAMANYPTYEPEKYRDVKDYSVFQNSVVSHAYETGSGVKVFTMSAGINEGVVSKNSTYHDSGFVQIGDRRIENAGSPGGVTRTMLQVIQNSVNTGVVHVLSQLGGGTINTKARETLYEYFTQHFGFGSKTGIAQTSESPGYLVGPNEQEGNSIRYANMAFGQGMTVTMLQMVAAFSSVMNGGTYYTPHIVEEIGDVAKVPIAKDVPVIKESTSKDLLEMTKAVVEHGGGYSAQRSGYNIGGKTGTAQVLEDNGQYSDSREIGSFIGYTGAEKPSYVIMTRVDEPQIPGYAGSIAAAPIFADISNWLIDYYGIPPIDP